MTLEEKITQDLKDAIKNKDEQSKRGIRAIKAALQLAKTEGGKSEVTSETELKILQKLVKQRRESLETYEKNNREDLARIEREEIAVIERYLPRQLSEEEIVPLVREIIAQTGAESMKDMGKVMGIATKKLAGKADGKTISAIVRRELS